jgi:NADPH:quinone reductase-like Zn-dependent oxidoreductase
MPKAISIKKVEGRPGSVYYPLVTIDLPEFAPKPDQLVIAISAAALNHRDHFIRQHLYPGTTFGVPLLADGCGTVISAGSDSASQAWIGKRVIVNPGSGWKDAVEGPEGAYAILGGTKFHPAGMLAEQMLVDTAEVIDAPEHLSGVEAAALPLAGLTAWRALVTKSGNADPGKNILITGIGGGVALMALLFGVARGCNVYVTSGSPEKLAKAKELGAKGGVNYKDENWEKTLAAQLPNDRKTFDAIIDGAGGDIVMKGMKLLKVSNCCTTQSS